MKISIYIATSANGLISNSRNVPDWLSPEYGQGMYAQCQHLKAVIMGKTTYITPKGWSAIEQMQK